MMNNHEPANFDQQQTAKLEFRKDFDDILINSQQLSWLKTLNHLTE